VEAWGVPFHTQPSWSPSTYWWRTVPVSHMTPSTRHTVPVLPLRATPMRSMTSPGCTVCRASRRTHDPGPGTVVMGTWCGAAVPARNAMYPVAGAPDTTFTHSEDRRTVPSTCGSISHRFPACEAVPLVCVHSTDAVPYRASAVVRTREMFAPRLTVFVRSTSALGLSTRLVAGSPVPEYTSGYVRPADGEYAVVDTAFCSRPYRYGSAQ